MKKLVIFLIFVSGIYTIDQCESNKSYQSCINSSVFKICKHVSNYLLGCNPNLFKEACMSQIGDPINQIVKCRFIVFCQDMLATMTESCSNYLNKFGCLSIINPNQICYWENDFCHTLQQEEWNSIQLNFENYEYSQSACSHIEHYLIIHHQLLWEIIGYNPNIIKDAETINFNYQGIETKENVKFYNSSASLQNNYQLNDGNIFESIVPSNREYSSYIEKDILLQKSKIILIMKQSSVYQVRQEGVNHIFCQYLNKQITFEPYYVFSQGKCQQFKQVYLDNQLKIQDLNCESLNLLYRIYFYSFQNKCKIQDQSYEYQCLTSYNSIYDDLQDFQTRHQCQEKENYYIDYSNNQCVNECLQISSEQDCKNTQNCFFLGKQFLNKVIVCSPPQLCDQIGLSSKSCKYLRAKCHWDDDQQQCFTLKDEQIQYFKCNDAFNIYLCTLITLSDQLCFWNTLKEQCMNILDQPILLTYSYPINHYVRAPPSKHNKTTISNHNLCIYSDNYYVYYQNDERRCYFYPYLNLNNDLPLSRFDCLNSDKGLAFWNQKYLLCESLQIENIRKTQCLDLYDINEKICQYALVSNINNFCYFDNNDQKCQELSLSKINDISCDGNGLSQNICIQKYMCQYQGQQCSKLSEEYINSLNCQTFNNVNEEVCSFHNKDSELCDYNDLLHTCYSPSTLREIKYSKFLNRFSCQKVIDQPTYYDAVEFKCKIINFEKQEILQITNSNNFYLSKMSCNKLKIKDNNCYWSESDSMCKKQNQNFITCDEYGDVENLCTALEKNQNQLLLKANFCSYYDNKCQQNLLPIPDCGENEIMNIHRCSGLSGLDQNFQPIQMSVFYNQQCKSLYKNDLNTEIILNQIQCKQANFSACVNVTTPGQFCVTINNISKNISFLDRKCLSTDYSSYNCQTLSQLYSQDIINKSFCSQAIDSCYYQQNVGCTTPTQIDMDCQTPGLSAKGCFNNTKNRRCAYLNNQCQYLSEVSITTECSNLNKFLCEQYKYAQCKWNQDKCENDTKSLNIPQFTCSRINDSESVLNYDACQRLTNHFCIFIQNQCQFIVKYYVKTQQENVVKIILETNPVFTKVVYVSMHQIFTRMFNVIFLKKLIMNSVLNILNVLIFKEVV